MGEDAFPAAPLRLSDAERQRAADLLADHAAAGRLDLTEYEQRVFAVYQAKTQRDLEPLFVDLPGPVTAHRSRARPGPVPRGVTVLLFVVLAASFTAHAGFPPLFMLPVLWCWSRRRHHPCGPQYGRPLAG